MDVTQHAQKRIKERCGLPKRAVARNAKLALQEGVFHSECTGRLKKYMDYLFLHSEYRCGKIRMYNNHVYLFTAADTLITVLKLPNIYKDAINKIIKKKREQFGQNNHS